MTRIIWLASYPRSGNTWLRFLLYHLYHGVPFASRQVGKFIPSFHQGLSAEFFAQGSPNIVKTHLEYRDDMPLGECSAGAIYLYRHPQKVMASNVRYMMRLVPYEDWPFAARSALVSRLVAEFCDNRGLLGWRSAGYGSWDENVRSWIGEPRKFPVLPLRYENLLHEPLPEIDRICTFLGLEASPAVRAAAIENTGERVLMAMEERELHHGWPGLFANRIAAGSRAWRFVRDTSLEPLHELVSADLLARATDAMSAMARQFGCE